MTLSSRTDRGRRIWVRRLRRACRRAAWSHHAEPGNSAQTPVEPSRAWNGGAQQSRLRGGDSVMAANEQTLGIVWAETARLVPFDGSDTTRQRLQAVVGRLVDQARSLGSTANFARPAA